MGNFQVQMSDKKEENIRKVLNYAQAKFQLSGEKFSYGKALEKVMLEWGQTNGFIDPNSKEKAIEKNNIDIRGNPQVMEHIQVLIKRLEKTPNVGTSRKLKGFIHKIDPTWIPPSDEPETKHVIDKAKEVFGSE